MLSSDRYLKTFSSQAGSLSAAAEPPRLASAWPSTVAAGSYTALRACLTQLSSASSSSVGPTGVYASLAAGGALASAGLPGGMRRVQWPPGMVVAASSSARGRWLASSALRRWSAALRHCTSLASSPLLRALSCLRMRRRRSGSLAPSRGAQRPSSSLSVRTFSARTGPRLSLQSSIPFSSTWPSSACSSPSASSTASAGQLPISWSRSCAR
mmetsp:Transcript_17525/g.56513  ORF Transcript_17525/g.56513 Transcript_17525/m.56513 type:complete len:212 (-) Transcript_17525:697-1332(-)